MTIEEQLSYWFELAEEDEIVAHSNFENGHFQWCLFICHLVLEKALKGLYIQHTNETQPKTHDLVKLAKLSSIPISDKDLHFLNEMNRFNIETRYPEYKRQINRMLQ